MMKESSVTIVDVMWENPHPVVGVDCACAAANVRWNAAGIAGPEEDSNERIRTLHRVPAASDGIKVRSIAIGRRRLHATTRISIRVHVAVVHRSSTGHDPTCRHVTVRASVQRNCVRCLVIDTLDPVDKYSGRKRLRLSRELRTIIMCTKNVYMRARQVQWFVMSHVCPLTISTSPPLGQFEPSVSHAAGHVEQPCGM